jgi:nucleotide-binding universal stress UspA family protein
MDFKKILVGVHAVEGRSLAFDMALSLAKKEGAELMLLHCLRQATTAEMEDRIGTFIEMEDSEGTSVRQHRQDEEIDHLGAWLDSLCKEAADQGVSAKSVVEVGAPGKQIIDMATHWEADLIVIRRTHRGALAERLLGSVANDVVHHAQCPVLLVQ